VTNGQSAGTASRRTAVGAASEAGDMLTTRMQAWGGDQEAAMGRRTLAPEASVHARESSIGRQRGARPKKAKWPREGLWTWRSVVAAGRIMRSIRAYHRQDLKAVGMGKACCLSRWRLSIVSCMACTRCPRRWLLGCGFGPRLIYSTGGRHGHWQQNHACRDDGQSTTCPCGTK